MVKLRFQFRLYNRMCLVYHGFNEVGSLVLCVRRTFGPEFRNQTIVACLFHNRPEEIDGVSFHSGVGQETELIV